MPIQRTNPQVVVRGSIRGREISLSQKGKRMYKKIVERIVRSSTNENLSKVMDMIDTVFEQKQINWNDREILYALVVKYWKS